MSTTESRSAARRERRQKRRAFRKTIHASLLFNKLLRMTFVPWLRIRFNLKEENLEAVNRLPPPYLLLPNHTCVFDPFLVNSLVRPPVHYVVTDASFRSRLVALGHSLVGSIPKTKVMSDMESMRNIMSVRDRGGIIGIFPEGQSSWDGHTLPLLSSTGKLVKLLKIPVVTARVTGAYLSWPRWAKKGRHGNVRVHFEIAYTPEELKRASPDEIQERIAQLLEQDAFEHNRAAMQKFEGKDRAEYLERALFICPACERIGTLDSSGDEFGCIECGYGVRFNEYGFFEPLKGPLHFTTVREWNVWQIDEYTRRLDQYLDNQQDGPFLAGERVRVQVGRRSEPLSPFHEGTLEILEYQF